MDYSDEGELLKDKFFFTFKAENTRGKFISEFEGGRNIWTTEAEIQKMDKLFDGVDETLDLIKKNADQKFIETKYKVKGF